MKSNMPPLQDIKALTFDVFGTCVDWRTTVVAEVWASWTSKAESQDLTEPAREKLKSLMHQDAEDFAQQWRNSYRKFTSSFVPGETPWKDVDTHHYDSLILLLQEWGISEAYSDGESRELSLVWHRLVPWTDSIAGLRRLNAKYTTATLSNGNQELLKDLNRMLDDGFQLIFSVADFGAYKPNPLVHDGTVSKLGLPPEHVALVAAHLGDLKAARGRGMKTIYVERLAEEVYGPEEIEKAREWVDIWVPLEEEGFIEVARRLGC